jgi:hypothetical protein
MDKCSLTTYCVFNTEVPWWIENSFVIFNSLEDSWPEAHLSLIRVPSSGLYHQVVRIGAYILGSQRKFCEVPL